MKKVSQTRRDFLASSSKTVIGLGAVAHALSAPTPSRAAQEKSRIIVVRNERAVNDRNACDPGEAGRMIENALLTFTGKSNVQDAWASLGLTKADRVGIKVNCNSSRFRLFAHPELVSALCDSLSTIVSKNNIIIYERRSSELQRAGFTINTGKEGVRCVGTDEGGGFHKDENLTNIIATECTKLINLPSLKTFGGEFAGTLFFKNHIGSLPHSHMPRCHGNTKFITEVNARSSIKDKTMLVLCDGLRGTYTESSPWYWKGIIMGCDPVAAEVTALGIINEKRAQENLAPLEVPSYVKLADTTYHLGTSDPAGIETVTKTM